MSLLTRRSIPKTPILVLVAVPLLLALPVSWSPRDPGNAIAPALVWAGGSPDETLAPLPPRPSAVAPTKPTTKTSVAGWQTDTDVSPTAAYSRERLYLNTVSTRYLWHILWRVSATLAVKW